MKKNSIDELVRDACKVIPMSKSEMRERLEELFDIAWTSGRKVEEDKSIPMGVSQWRNHGKEYGYDEYFLEEYKKELLKKLPKKKDGFLMVLGDIDAGIHKKISASSHNKCLKKITKLIKE